MSVLLTRRLLMLGAIAGISASGLPRSVVAAAAADRTARRGPVACVLDSSMDQFLEWRAAAEGAGMVVTEFERDVGLLAMQVDARWRVARSPLSGITLASSYFILEQIARRHGMVPVSVGEHCRDSDGGWRHDLSAQSPTVLETVSRLPGDNWRSQVCNVLHEASRGSSAPPVGLPARLVSRCDEKGRGPLRLLSWSLVADA